MQRRLDLLTDRHFDVLVIGGGICGLTIACDAAQRGLSVALVERHDFGSGTSFNHLRTIHGGLRYLQHLDLARARESIRERRALAIIAPWAVVPVPFVLPLTASLAKGPWAMRAAFLLDRALASRRNDGLPASHYLPAGQVLRVGEAIERFPVLAGMPMAGAAVWFDYVATEADTLTLAWGKAAAVHGATLSNYVNVTALRVSGGRVVGADAVDGPTQTSLAIRAKMIVNATGAALERLLAPLAVPLHVPMTRALNIVTRLEAPAAAIGGRLPAGRNLFMVPWRGRALFGTWESGRVERPDDPLVSVSLVAEFVRAIQTAFPAMRVTDDAVTLVHRGLVPAARRGDTVIPAGHEQVHDHADAGHGEIVSVAATKYTTARAVAEKVTNLLLARLGKPAMACRTATTPLPAVATNPSTRLMDAARDEMVVTLEDAVVRRTPIGAFGQPADDVLEHAASTVGGVLGWNETRQAEEIERVKNFYARLKPTR